ncbi:hypothetical protein [Oryzobacter terrae]|uniref:hypothetical protein n=1 Tax=Oryzobacter terrae TaxID=1620385 RepID=UPI00367309C0
MRTPEARRRTLTVLVVMVVLTAAAWALVLVEVVDGSGLTALRAVAWLLTALTGGAALGLRDAGRAHDEGMRTPQRQRPTPPQQRPTGPPDDAAP